MAYNIKYFYNFKSIGSNDNYEVQILENAAASNIEVRADIEPFSVQYTEAKRVYTAVRASGCDLGLISPTDRYFFSLFTNDIFKYQIKLTKAGTLVWCGYLDTEMYSEDFNTLTNYPVKFSGSDGFNMLDRINFLDSSKNKYSGTKTQFQVLQIILDKLALPYNAIYIGLSTTSNQLSISASETILHKTYVLAENYYDEDQKPMTCREVLDSLLKPYGASIIQVNGSIYIYDLNTVLTSPASFKKYNASTYAYISTDSITTNLGDLSTIKFTGSNIRFDTVPAINKQKIKYSPYSVKELLNFQAGDKEFIGKTGAQNYGVDNADYKWCEYYYNDIKSLNYTGGTGAYLMLGTGAENSDSSDYYLKMSTTNNYSSKWKFKVKPYLKTNDYTQYLDNVYFLKISCSAYFRTKTYENKPDENTFDGLRRARLFLNVVCGGAQWNAAGWNVFGVNTPSYVNSYQLSFADNLSYDTPIGDQWKNSASGYNYEKDFQLLPLYVYLNSPLEVTILQACELLNASGSDMSANVKDIRIKELKFELCDSKGNILSPADFEYISYLDDKYKNDGDVITLVNGTNKTNHPLSYGSLTTGAQNITGWTRQGSTAKIEELLLNSVQSNYENPASRIAASINLPASLMGYVTYNNFLSGQKLVPLAFTLNYAENIADVSLIESKADNLTLNIIN